MGEQRQPSVTAARWDLFISHASEDKESFVKPLAGALSSFGVRVWYEEYTLKLGDSLSRSIDNGLANSNFGLVVLSPGFFAKRWPEYELRGLTARENTTGKVILPVWHKVTKEDVLRFSPPLADKLAVRTDDLTPIQIAFRIIQAIRPDIFQRILRRLAYVQMVRNAKIETVDLARIKISPIRHKELPSDLVRRARLVRASLLSAFPHSMAWWLGGFKRDSHPSDEVAYWEHVAAVYQESLSLFSKPPSREKRVSIFDLIFALQSNDEAAIRNCAKKLPKGYANAIRNLYKFTQPPYDFDEDFPSSIRGESSGNKASNNYDIEHFPVDLPADLISELLDDTAARRTD